MGAPMNVLFITADQWRGDCLSSEKPEWRTVDDDHFVACHFADELSL